MVALAATIAVVVVAAVVLVAVVTHNNNTNSASTAQTNTPTTIVTGPSDAAAPPTTSISIPPADPLQQLQQLAAQDEPYILANLADQWVPQLSSKHPGIYDDGIVYNDASTLQEHLRLRQQYNAKLLWSGNWSNYDYSDFWVTIVAAPSSDPGSALQWCYNQNLNDDHCFAERVSKTHPAQGSTVHQQR